MIEARAKATSIQVTPETLNNPEAFKKFQSAQGELGSALSRLMVVAEQYPNLKANQGFSNLRVQLEGTENRITVARNRYIKTIEEYNVLARSFPSNLTAMVFSYQPKPGFAVANEAQITVPELTRQRATMQFGRMRVWDTESNNGVLIYLLLVERKIELLADRGVNAVVSSEQWQSMVQHMAQTFATGQFEKGLTQALEEVSVPLVQHFPARLGSLNPNELPDHPEVG